jgi:hypothetical protein
MLVVENGTYSISGIKVRDVLIDRDAERQLTIGVAKKFPKLFPHWQMGLLPTVG